MTYMIRMIIATLPLFVFAYFSPSAVAQQIEALSDINISPGTNRLIKMVTPLATYELIKETANSYIVLHCCPK